MRLNSVLMLVLAAVFGVLALLAGRAWVTQQMADLERRHQAVAVAEAPPPPPMGTLVVAAEPLRYGEQLEPRHLREIAWPAETLPEGAFANAGELLSGERRIVLSAMQPNEPVLAGKITGPGQRGTLSALIGEGMGAVTIQVNEVIGIAGFVMPGDRVDVIMTHHDRNADEGAAGAQSGSFSDIVVQNLKVLATGQIADETASKPVTVTAVTLEVDRIGAQKIALATRAGVLSLILRPAGEVAQGGGRRVVLSEIGSLSAPGAASTATIRVARGSERAEYAVPAEPGTPAPRLAPPPALAAAIPAPPPRPAAPLGLVQAGAGP